MQRLSSSVLRLLLPIAFLPSLTGCLIEDQTPAQEAITATRSEDSSDLPPEATSDLESESVTHASDPGLTAADIEADNDPMKIGFETARWNLSETALARIQDVADRMKEDPKARLAIGGHCDERGSDTYNEALSIKRAKAVQEALIERGVSGARLKVKGYGRRKTLVKGSGEAVYSHNRRVEMVFQ